MILKLSNKENTYTFTVDDLNNGEKLYYKFQIPASDVVDGKYNMVLMDDDGNIITEEQVCMGNFNAETIQYNRGENVYINSPLNANLEDVRTITIDVPNYTIYPSEGYDAMKEVVVDAQPVYDNGYNEGEIAQKAKLTGITITENGIYSREDGYNEITVDVPDLNGDYNEGYDAGKVDGYDSGYTAGIDYASENAGEIAAANAIDLVATEFGTYYTKYSDNIVYPEVTGVFPNGENFYNYAYTDKIYDTGIAPNANSEIELWFKPDGAGGTWGCIISAGYQDNNKYTIRIRRTAYDAVYIANFGEGMGNGTENGVTFNLNIDVFNHIKLSANGLYVNGVFYDGFEPGNFTPQGTFVIDGFTGNWAAGETGYYGMIKITTDDVVNVIVPTEDGFKNITTNTIIPQIYEDIGSRYDYKNNDPIILDNLIKSVDVQPKINVGKYDIKFGHSSFAEVPDFFDFEGITDIDYLFSNCGSLRTLPFFDTSLCTSMRDAFSHCGSLKTLPPYITSNVTSMYQMCYESRGLESLPAFDASKVTDMNRYFGYYGYGNFPNLTDVGGWINLSCNWNDNYSLVSCPNLTYQSCINILNGLADVTELGGRTLKVHSNFLTTVGDEISIGTLKGWSISV